VPAIKSNYIILSRKRWSDDKTFWSKKKKLPGGHAARKPCADKNKEESSLQSLEGEKEGKGRREVQPHMPSQRRE